MSKSLSGRSVGAFLLGCVCVLVAVAAVRGLLACVPTPDRLDLALHPPSGLEAVAGQSEPVAGNQSYSVCVCPSCGTTVTQLSKVKCINLRCPECGSPMVSPGSVFAWRQLVFRPIVIAGLIIIALVLTAHYLIWGPKKVRAGAAATIERFSAFETAWHFVFLISFGVLAATGLAGIIGPGANISGSVGGDFFLVLHYLAAAGFAAALAALAPVWYRDCFFHKDDLEWFRHGGGYFGYEGPLPAGRFNPGQKAFFWFVFFAGLVMAATGSIRLFPVFTREVQQAAYMVHDIVALALVLGVAAHAYLGTLANPGSWQGIFSGWVAEEWAKAHHPNWDYAPASSALDKGLSGSGGVGQETLVP